jgi:hypothetical protein
MLQDVDNGGLRAGCVTSQGGGTGDNDRAMITGDSGDLAVIGRDDHVVDAGRLHAGTHGANDQRDAPHPDQVLAGNPLRPTASRYYGSDPWHRLSLGALLDELRFSACSAGREGDR